MDDNYKLAMLFDLYSGLLTDKQREIFEFYHNEDLSLGEIAENLGITRQGVRDALVHAESTLRDTETALNFLEEHDRNSRLLKDIKADIQALHRTGYARHDAEFAAALSDLESKVTALSSLE